MVAPELFELIAAVKVKRDSLDQSDENQREAARTLRCASIGGTHF